MALFWLRTSYHAQRYMFQRYMLRSLLTQSFNIVNTPIILLFSTKWVPGFAAEDNTVVAAVLSLQHYLEDWVYQRLGLKGTYGKKIQPPFSSQTARRSLYWSYEPWNILQKNL